MLKKLTQPELAGWKADRKYPLMFTTTTAGKIRVWACWVKGDTVFRTDGFIDGKLKEPQTHQYKGNSLRTGAEQAPLEAEKMWLKQFDHDYAPADEDKAGQQVYTHVKQQKEQNGGMNRGVKLFGKTEISTKTTAGNKDLSAQHRPMLAKKYKDYNKAEDDYILTNPGKAIKFPALAQAKVDGIRALPQLRKDGTVVLESRNGNSFVHLNHLRDEIQYWLAHKGYSNVILDGEMYVHRMYRDKNGEPTYDYTDQEMQGVERYQFISEACKITRSKPHDHEEMVEYWVFDIWDPSKTNMERYELLQEIFEDYDGDILKLVPTRVVNSHDEIEDFMTELVGESSGRSGYEFEGLMVRQAASKYAPSTTKQSCLLKYKRFEDEEWEVCGAEKCTGGTQDGACKWICNKTVKGKVRKVTAKQMGDAEASRKLYQAYKKNPSKYNGRMINIRFNDKTKDGVPRFPRATAFVEDK
ncbi:hypothetical protein LCGC14_1603790 [marine sediment metagenome]|uniref:Polydeoxyribonucleotide synthase [ATP] n=2 Tax=root TaxID=1 RepID=A0A0F9KR64_9ZZZZ|nr:MAG: ATP-dependent DNA ligase [Marseillevirus LCMAC202]